jgi:carbon-monoxide dehydrogenase medium subunit
MPDVTYARPETVEEACSVLDEYGDAAAVLSGGQSLLPMLRQRLDSYEHLVDINGLPEMDYVRATDGRVRIGCLVRHADVVASGTVREACPVLAETAETIGDTQVRNRGTFCGAVAHADPAGDPPVLARLLDAEIVARGVDGETTYEADSFFHGFYETRLGTGELVTEVSFPALGDGEGAGYAKWEPNAGSYPVATVGARVTVADGTVASASLVTGALEDGPTPMPDAAARLEGEAPDDDAVTAAAERVGADARPFDDFEGGEEFKRRITASLAKDALGTALGRAGA